MHWTSRLLSKLLILPGLVVRTINKKRNAQLPAQCWHVGSMQQMEAILFSVALGLGSRMRSFLQAHLS
jgi:hypothetical protein